MTATAKINIPIIIATSTPIAMGIDFSKNFGYARFGGVSGEFSTI
jgi:formate dehydrogenase assembly factor FdhD